MYEESDSDDCFENKTVVSMNLKPSSSFIPRSYRRDVSPMSVKTMYDIQPRNFHMAHSRGKNSQRCTFRSRAGSPMSMRSTESYRNLQRKEMEKRRKRRIQKNKCSRYRRGYDSGEEGSDSSVSSDGRSTCRSVISSASAYRLQNNKNYTHEGSRDPSMSRDPRLFRDPRFFARTTSSNSLYYNKSIWNVTETSQYTGDWEHVSQSSMQKPIPQFTLQNRFNSQRFLSQKFHRSIEQPVQENGIYNMLPKNLVSTNNIKRPNDIAQFNDIDQEEIISRGSQKPIESPRSQKRRRSLDEPDQITSVEKKSKTTSTQIVNTKSYLQKEGINHGSEFEFAKPQLPVKKQKDKVYSKVGQSNINLIRKEIIQKPSPIKTKTSQETVSFPPNCTKDSSYDKLDITRNTTEVSMRPSFIKRKLFTQTLDVTENKNDSFGSNSSNSPLPKSSNSMTGEKNKIRKIVTNQLCLSRDIDNSNNLLDLIQKIVPLEQANATKIDTNSNKANKTTNKKSINDTEKWDIISIVTSYNNEEGSDTFTDEEFFMTGRNKSKVENEFKIKSLAQPNLGSLPTQKPNQENESPIKNVGKITKPAKASDALPKLKNYENQKPFKVNLDDEADTNSSESLNESTCAKQVSKQAPVTPKKATRSNVELFWNTDTDSDIERSTPDKRPNVLKALENKPKQTTSLQCINTKTNLNSILAFDRASLYNKNTKEDFNKPDSGTKNPKSKPVARKSKLGDATVNTFNATSLSNFAFNCDEKFLKNSTRFIPNKTFDWASSTLRTQNRTAKTCFEDRTMDITNISKTDQTFKKLKNGDGMCKVLRNSPIYLSGSVDLDVNNTVLTNVPRNGNTNQTSQETKRSRSKSPTIINEIKYKEKVKNSEVKGSVQKYKENNKEVKNKETKDKWKNSQGKDKETQGADKGVIQVKSSIKIKTSESRNIVQEEKGADRVKASEIKKAVDSKNVKAKASETNKGNTQPLKADKENINTNGRPRTRSVGKESIKKIKSFEDTKRKARSRSRDVINHSKINPKVVFTKQLVTPDIVQKSKKLVNRDKSRVLNLTPTKNKSDLSFTLNTSISNRPFRKVREKSFFNRSMSLDRLQVKSSNKNKELESRNTVQEGKDADSVNASEIKKAVDSKNIKTTSSENNIGNTKPSKADKENVNTIGRPRTRSAGKDSIKTIESFQDTKRKSRSPIRDVLNHSKIYPKVVHTKLPVRPDIVEKSKKLVNRDKSKVLNLTPRNNKSDLSFSLNTSISNRPFRKVREKSFFNRSMSLDRLQGKSSNKIQELESRNTVQEEKDAYRVKASEMKKAVDSKNAKARASETNIGKPLKADKKNIKRIGRPRTRSSVTDFVKMIESFQDTRIKTRSQSRDVIIHRPIDTKVVLNKLLVTPDIVEKSKKVQKIGQ